MDIKNKNFLITKNEVTRKILLEHDLTELPTLDDTFIFINEPKKLIKFEYEKLDIVPTNKLNF